MSKSLCVWWFICLVLLLACDSRHASGPSSVETQNSIAGIVQRSNGQAAAGAHVSVYRASQIGGRPLAEGTTNANGAYSLAVPDARMYSVQIQDSGLCARALQEGTTDSTYSQTSVLAKPLHAWLILSPESDWPKDSTTVQLFGANQTWSWNSVQPLAWSVPASGIYALHLTSGAFQAEVVVNVRTEGDTIRIAPTKKPSVLLTNFDNNCTRSDLGFVLGSGWSFALEGGVPAERHLGGGEKYLCEKDSLRNQVLHVHWVPSTDYFWMDVGFGLGDSTNPMNLAKMDSVIFWAKGTGSLRLELITANIRMNQSNQYAEFPIFTLTANWFRYSFPVTELKFPIGSHADSLGITWLTSASKTNLLQWSSPDSVEFWIDEIRFSGTLLSDL